MSGLERLVPLIYHEKQQSGSQLCAQHALNGVLQGDFFQAPDLAQLAHELDTLEGAVNEDAGPVSNNMDDTGFFSVGVLEKAISVWGFTLVRWRSQEMRDYQETPHHQMAFVLNHQEHWFSLRRFGQLTDPENGHWFNLNSFLPEPEWIGKLYLGMVLAQAEDEGYSVFAVVPLHEPGSPSILPRTDADDVASTLPQPTSANMGTRMTTSRTISNTTAPTVSKPSEAPSGFEDEDMELQAALQASLVADGALDYSPVADLPPPSMPGAFGPVAGSSNALGLDDDSIEARMARTLERNKNMMAQALREQEMAFRDGYEDEVQRHFGGRRQQRGVGPGAGAHAEIEDDDEEENIRRAIEMSRGEHAGTGDDAQMEDDDDAEWLPPRATRAAAEVTPAITVPGDRIYDDEDSDLQAALKASLEGLPEGFVMPATPPLNLPPGLPIQPRTEVQASASSRAAPQVQQEAGEDEEKPDPTPEPTPQLGPEEIRRRRLARFGGQ